MTEQSKLSEQCALVAGGSSGLGLAVARTLASEGCDLHLAGRGEDRLEDAVDALEEDFAVDIETHATDLSDAINAAALALECDDAGILVNVFGGTPAGGILDLEDEDWRQGFELKVFGTINLCREMFQALGETSAGVIVNVGCPSGDICNHTVNAAVTAFSENLDREARKEGVRVLFYQPSADLDSDENAHAIVKLILGQFAS
ncbi:MAG: SDR family NAD(P)-dependent oxidoreductase [Alphaproteobacteria bacterium]